MRFAGRPRLRLVAVSLAFPGFPAYYPLRERTISRIMHDLDVCIRTCEKENRGRTDHELFGVLIYISLSRYGHPVFPHEDDVVHVGPWDVGNQPIADWCTFSIDCQYEVRKWRWWDDAGFLVRSDLV